MSIPAQDFIILAGRKSPGLAKIRGGGSPRNWDIQQGYGLAGATIVFAGSTLAKFDVEFSLWEPEQFDEWRAFAKGTLALPPPKRIATSLGIQHPELNAFPLEITQVVVEDVSKFEQDDVGLWTCVVKFIAFRAPKPILATPIQGPPAVNNDEPPDPAAAGIRARLAVQEQLAAELARGVPR